MIIVILTRNQVLDYIEVGLIFSGDTNDLFEISRKSRELYGNLRLLHSRKYKEYLKISPLFVSSFVCAQFFKWLKNFKASFHLSNLTLIREKERIFDYCIQIISNVSRFHGEIFLKKARNSKNSNPEFYCSNFRILYTFYNSRNCDLDLDEAKQRL